MNIETLLEIVERNENIWIAATISGIFAVILSVLNAVLLLLQRKRQIKYDKIIENYRSMNNRRNFVSKTRFDTEFSIYRELTAFCRNMMCDVCTVLNNMPHLIDIDNRENTMKKAIYSANKACTEFNVYLTSNAPFIPKDYYEKYKIYMDLCKRNLNKCEGDWSIYLDAWRQNDLDNVSIENSYEVQKIYMEYYVLIDYIRDYLANLEVA